MDPITPERFMLRCRYIYQAATIDELTRQIQEKVYNKYGIAIATVGVYSDEYDWSMPE